MDNPNHSQLKISEEKKKSIKQLRMGEFIISIYEKIIYYKFYSLILDKDRFNELILIQYF